jgi:hypothetical protein
LVIRLRHSSGVDADRVILAAFAVSRQNTAIRRCSPQHLNIVKPIEHCRLRGQKINGWFLAADRTHDVKPEVVVGLIPDRHG